MEAPAKPIKAPTTSASSSSAKVAATPKATSFHSVIDLSGDIVSLTIIKDAIRSSGRFLSESPAMITASKGAHAQTIIFHQDMPLPLTYSDIFREAKVAFKGDTDFELNAAKYTLHRFTPYMVEFKETARSHAKPLTILEIL